MGVTSHLQNEGFCRCYRSLCRHGQGTGCCQRWLWLCWCPPLRRWRWLCWIRLCCCPRCLCCCPCRLCHWLCRIRICRCPCRLCCLLSAILSSKCRWPTCKTSSTDKSDKFYPQSDHIGHYMSVCVYIDSLSSTVMQRLFIDL